MTDLTEFFPIKVRDDVPPEVDGFLHVCEIATAWGDWQREHRGEMKEHFCAGVVDYWWDDLEEPSFDQLFHRPLDLEGEWSGWPSRKRFAYQQGAIVGYKLSEIYG